MPYCFSRSFIKFQGHTGQKVTDFDLNWAFPDCNPRTPVWIQRWIWNEEVPYYSSRSSIKFQGYTGWKMYDLNPIWVRLLSRSQLSNPSDLPWVLPWLVTEHDSHHLNQWWLLSSRVLYTKQNSVFLHYIFIKHTEAWHVNWWYSIEILKTEAWLSLCMSAHWKHSHVSLGMQLIN